MQPSLSPRAPTRHRGAPSRSPCQALHLALALLAFAPALAAAAPSDEEVDQPFRQRSLSLHLDGDRFRARRSGGEAFGDGALSINGSTALAGRTRVAGEDVSAWGLLGQVEGRAFTTDLSQVEGSDRFLRFGVSLGAFYAPSLRNELWFQGGAFVAAQTSQLHSPTLRFHGAFVGAHRTGPDLRLLYGVAYTYRFGRGLPLPLLGANWRFAPAWRLTLLLPLQARVTWRVSHALFFGGGLSTQGDLFRYQARDATGVVSRQDLRIARVRLGVSGGYTLSKGARVELETGLESATVDTGLSREKALGGYLGASIRLGAGARGPLQTDLGAEP